MRYGISLEQGVRETMEDAAQVVQHGRCGFFFASECDAVQAGEACCYFGIPVCMISCLRLCVS
jgi:hypothetical protein